MSTKDVITAQLVLVLHHPPDSCVLSLCLDHFLGLQSLPFDILCHLPSTAPVRLPSRTLLGSPCCAPTTLWVSLLITCHGCIPQSAAPIKPAASWGKGHVLFNKGELEKLATLETGSCRSKPRTGFGLRQWGRQRGILGKTWLWNKMELGESRLHQ